MIKHYMTKFIANSINFEDLEGLGYEEGTLKDAYMVEFGYFNGYNLESVKDWLQGLPSVITFPFYNSDILDGLEEAGLETVEGEGYILVEKYWAELADYVMANIFEGGY